MKRDRSIPRDQRTPAHKECRLCGIDKSIDEFSKQLSYYDGYRNWCKACCNIRAKTYPTRKRKPLTPEQRIANRKRVAKRYHGKNKHDPEFMQRQRDRANARNAYLRATRNV